MKASEIGLTKSGIAVLATAQMVQESSPHLDEAEYARCCDWVFSRLTDAELIAGMKLGEIAISWPAGDTEPSFTTTAKGVASMIKGMAELARKPNAGERE